MIFFDNSSGFWRWDRWHVGNGTHIPEWLVRHFHRTGEEDVNDEDLWRLV